MKQLSKSFVDHIVSYLHVLSNLTGNKIIFYEMNRTEDDYSYMFINVWAVRNLVGLFQCFTQFSASLCEVYIQ